MLVLLALGCISHLEQIGGTGSIYTTACTADMVQQGGVYEAGCTPRSCLPGYTDAGISHVATALDPGRRVIGVAERACVQDLSNAAALFEAPDAAELKAPAEGEAEPQ